MSENKETIPYMSTKKEIMLILSTGISAIVITYFVYNMGLGFMLLTILGCLKIYDILKYPIGWTMGIYKVNIEETFEQLNHVKKVKK